MRPRPVLALALGLVIFLTGCGEPGKTPHQAGGPAVTASATPAPKPTPTARPTRTTPPKAKLRPLPKTLPAGLHRSSGDGAVALTFDDGPDPRWTPQLLDQLRAAHITATFCLIGTQALGRRSDAEIRADLERTNRVIRAAVPDAEITWFRQPGGRWTAEEVAVARKLGMRALHWNVDPQDWNHPTAKTIAKRVKGAARPGSIVLMHDGGGDRSQTMAACRQVIPDLKRRYGITQLP